MYKVTKKPLTPNLIWDSENKKPLCRFVNGVLETDDRVIADKLASMGHTVEGESTKTEYAATEITETSTPKTTRRSRK